MKTIALCIISFISLSLYAADSQESSKTTSPEDVVKNFYLALSSQNKDEILKWIQPNPKAYILWEDGKVNKKLLSLAQKMECREYVKGAKVLWPNGERKAFPELNNKDVKLIIPYVNGEEIKLPTVVLKYYGDWRVSVKMLIKARLASKKAKEKNAK